MSSLLEEYHPATPLTNGHDAIDTPQPSPIQSFQLRQKVESSEIELLIQTFDDRILVIITQNGKVGCLTQASIPKVTPLPQPPRQIPSGSTSLLTHYPPPPPSITLTSLLGSPPNRALHETYVAHISTLIWWTLQETHEERRPVVVGLSLSRNITNTAAGGGQEAEEGSLELDEEERKKFGGVLGMVASWPGPRGS